MAHSDSLAQSPLPGRAPQAPASQAHPSQAQDESSRPSAGARTPIRILLAMATELDRMAWSIVLNNQSDIELVAATSSSRQLTRLLKLHAPHVVLLDEDLLRLCTPGALVAFARKTDCRFVLVAMHQPDYSLEPSQTGFLHARLLKGVSAPELLLTLRTAAAQGRQQRPSGH